MRRRPLQQVDLVDARGPLLLGHLLPELERTLQQRRRLADRVDALGRVGGADGRRQRRGVVAGVVPVMGDLRGEMGVGRLLRGDPLLQRARDGAVQLGPLARQQIVEQHLAQQRVAEAVAVVLVGDDDRAGDRLAQRVAQGARVERARLTDSSSWSIAAGDQQPQQLLRVGREPLDPQHQRVAQRRRQRAAAVEAGGEDLLGEERVALAADADPLDQGGVGRRAEQLRQLLGSAPRA